VADSLRFILADEHPIVRYGLRHLVTEDGHEVVAEVGDGQSLMEAVRQHKPDVVITEVLLPKLDGVEATRRLRAEGIEGVRFLMFSTYGSEEYVLRALSSGADGYVLKTCEGRDLLEAVRRARHGDTYLSPEVSTPVVLRNLRHGDLEDPLAMLTAREREVLRLVSEGLTNKEVASELGVAVKTVEAHRANLMRKLDLHDLSALIRFALRVGLLAPSR
jgi:DNA-binding NarL/FixJ family response regulator